MPWPLPIEGKDSSVVVKPDLNTPVEAHVVDPTPDLLTSIRVLEDHASSER